MQFSFNGQNIDPAQFARMQEQQEQQYWSHYNQLRHVFDCNNAIVDQQQLGLIVCSITRQQITDPNYCKNCASYNNQVYIGKE